MNDVDRQAWLDGITSAVAEAADCSRRKVAALIYDPATFHILAMGYNGRPSGLPGCLSRRACPRAYSDVASGSSYLEGTGRCDAIHAEDNALRRARERGIAVSGAHVTITYRPCEGCMTLMRHYGIARATWPGGQHEFTT